jgi:hypothetical protein
MRRRSWNRQNTTRYTALGVGSIQNLLAGLIAGHKACAANGQPATDTAIALMKSRRRIAFPKAQDCADFRLRRDNYSRDLRSVEGTLEGPLRGTNPEPTGQLCLPEWVQRVIVFFIG